MYDMFADVEGKDSVLSYVDEFEWRDDQTGEAKRSRCGV
jgi:hypothetical protein